MKAFLTLVLSCFALLAAISLPAKEKSFDMEHSVVLHLDDQLAGIASLAFQTDHDYVIIDSSAETNLQDDLKAFNFTEIKLTDHSPGMLERFSWCLQKLKYDVPTELGKPLPANKNYVGFRQLKA
ncbi:MAG: hypothetical protein NXI00_10970 [Cytophagales bacterium]|nr:hypothetical protein [Cytophagales bacterium]